MIVVLIAKNTGVNFNKGTIMALCNHCKAKIINKIKVYNVHTDTTKKVVNIHHSENETKYMVDTLFRQGYSKVYVLIEQMDQTKYAHMNRDNMTQREFNNLLQK